VAGSNGHGVDQTAARHWAGLRLAILLRRAVTMRLDYPTARWTSSAGACACGCIRATTAAKKKSAVHAADVRAGGACRTGKRHRPGEGSSAAVHLVDIGANVGLFSLFVASCAGRQARILAIEPEPGNLRRLEFNVRANPGVPITIISKALSDEAGVVTVELDRATAVARGRRK